MYRKFIIVYNVDTMQSNRLQSMKLGDFAVISIEHCMPTHLYGIYIMSELRMASLSSYSYTYDMIII